MSLRSYKRHYFPQNVFEKALDRIRWIYDEFENPCVGISSGEDSTVVLNLAAMAAKEKGRLPVTAIFVGFFEVEWESNLKYLRWLKEREDEDIDLKWIQMSIALNNMHNERHCWWLA